MATSLVRDVAAVACGETLSCLWEGVDRPLSSSDIIDLKYKNGVATLTITEVFPEDEAEYACTAKNSIGSISTKSKLSVTPMKSNIGRKKSKSGDRPPKIVSHLNSDFVKDGEPVTLSCRIIGAEKFDVIWLHNNKEIKPIKKRNTGKVLTYRKLENFFFAWYQQARASGIPMDGSILREKYLKIAATIRIDILLASNVWISHFKQHHGLVFKKLPKDSASVDTNETHLRFERLSKLLERYQTLEELKLPNEEPKSPVFKTFPQSATLQEGESVSFNCETEKVPLKVTWLKDGKPVDETSSKYQFVQDGKKKFKFEITNCNSLDVGQYTAKAVGFRTLPDLGPLRNGMQRRKSWRFKPEKKILYAQKRKEYVSEQAPPEDKLSNLPWCSQFFYVYITHATRLYSRQYKTNCPIDNSIKFDTGSVTSLPEKVSITLFHKEF
uniref:Uncharacterized protein n=1 Tax=Timema tahoe TaxID=61484 RepID=A0A7R9NUM6_9NEOP|nr:unnamed protein product [Timema tahoe]